MDLLLNMMLGDVNVRLNMAVEVKSNFCLNFVVEPGHTSQRVHNVMNPTFSLKYAQILVSGS